MRLDIASRPDVVKSEVRRDYADDDATTTATAYISRRYSSPLHSPYAESQPS
jgi:phage gp36-like protein